MSALNKLLKLNIACLIVVISGCTMPGHRQVIEESGFYLYIQSPSERIKKSIRFNPQKTKLIYLPEKVSIELLATDENGKRSLDIKTSKEIIVYSYKLNGRKAYFGIEEQQWFATLIPIIINKTGLENTSH